MRVVCCVMLAIASIAAAGCTRSDQLAVSLTESGRYKSLQAAVDALPADGGTIRIAPGVYRGPLHIGKRGVRLIGTGARPEDVVIVNTRSSATAGSIYASATTHVAGDDFYARNLTFANDWEADPKRGSTQAVALSVSGDRALFERIRVIGGQDTLYLAGPPGGHSRQMFRDCYIEGHVDFIFGNGAAYFDRCRIHGVAHHTVMYTAQARNTKDDGGGFVFHQSVFSAGAAPGGVYLGRPWRPYATMVLIDSRVETPIAATGWREWKPGMTQDGNSVTYAEYRTLYTHGAPARSRIRQLTADEAQAWSIDAFFKGDTQWTRSPLADN